MGLLFEELDGRPVPFHKLLGARSAAEWESTKADTSQNKTSNSEAQLCGTPRK